MAAETARKFEALEAQAARILPVFVQAGFEYVAPAIIQPADVYLDVIGEELRARTYVFTDPDGAELCLRPDLTVPACRLYLERHAKADVRARYAYNGPCFRFQPGGGGPVRPREFRQAGIESFAATDREKAEAEVVALTMEAIRTAGLRAFKLKIGDLGLFRALLRAIEMPDRWRRQLLHRLRRPDAFHRHLQRLTTNPAGSSGALPQSLIASLDTQDPEAAEAAVLQHLEADGIELIGTRTAAEIAAHLVEYAADARADPLPGAAASLIRDYIDIKGPPKAVGARIRDLMRERGVDLADALDTFKRRLELLTQEEIDVAQAEFSAEFGRNLEYYTGFVFELETPALGAGLNVAGGGRYDAMLRAVGAPHHVPAVGAAIHTERLLAAVRGEEP